MISIYWTKGKTTGVMTFTSWKAAVWMAASFDNTTWYNIVGGYHG